MPKDWRDIVLFFVGVGGVVLLLIGPEYGFEVSDNPVALGGLTSILAYVLTQLKGQRSKPEPPPDKKKEEDESSGPH